METKATAMTPFTRTLAGLAVGLFLAYSSLGVAAEPCVLEGNLAAVDALGFSADGKRLVSGSDDGQVRIWDVAAGNELKHWKAHDNRVSSLTMAPDGATFLTVSRDATAKVWELATGKERLALRGHTQRIYRGEYTPDGKGIVTAGRDGIRFWNLATGQPEGMIEPVDDEQYSFLDLHPQGTQLATSSRSGGILLWSLPRRKMTGQLPGHVDRTYCLRYFDRGKKLVSGGVDDMVRVWDVATAQEAKALAGHTGRVLCLAVLQDPSLAASGSEDHNVRMWDLRAGAAGSVLRGHTAPVQAVAFSPDGKLLASGGKDQTIRVWKLSAHKLEQAPSTALQTGTGY